MKINSGNDVDFWCTQSILDALQVEESLELLEKGRIQGLALDKEFLLMEDGCGEDIEEKRDGFMVKDKDGLSDSAFIAERRIRVG